MNSKLTHPVLKNGFENYFPEDQLYSVEHDIETLIPWIRYIEPMENKNVFVFGTGSGGTTVSCALYVGEGKVVGVDISENEIKKTKIRAKAYKVEDKVDVQYLKKTCPLPFEDEAFDIAIIHSVIEHIVDERGKYIKEVFRVLKRNGLLIISGTPNLLYPKDKHTTNLYFIPWLSKKTAYKYAVMRKKWKEGEDLEYAGRRGTTYWHLKKWLKGFSYSVLNEKPGFTSKYLKSSGRINSFKRKILFKPYMFLEFFIRGVFKLPITAVMPYLNHLFIRKN
jgi:ubiquinone/menaquinone biosynthesis C-methylase UbiE